MMFKSLLGTVGTCAILITAVSFQGVAEASYIGVTNSTKTIYDVPSGQLDFTWDRSSQYDITGTEVILKTDDIRQFDQRIIGTLYEFVIPNFYDPLPMKKIEITMVGANAGSGEFDLPYVLDIIGADSDYINGGPALPVDGIFMAGKSSPTLVSEYWEMFPNPDFEIVKIFAPIAFELQGITIETQSTVPVPAAVWLFGSGLIGLIGIARRKTT